MIVAQYEVLGNCVKRYVVPERDDRTPGSWSAYGFASTSNHRSSLRDGRVFFAISRSGSRRIPGYYQNVPSGQKCAVRIRKRSIKNVRAKRQRTTARTPQNSRKGLTLKKSSLSSAKPLKIKITHLSYGYLDSSVTPRTAVALP